MSQTLSSVEILKEYESIKSEKPMARAKDIADSLSISEGELVASRVGSKIFRLIDDPQEILSSIEQLGSVMALTRNKDCVHERHGIYSNGSFESHGPMNIGLFVNPDIDLRLFMSHWKYCYSLTEEGSNRTLRSIQFFDKAGIAIHKIYALEDHQKEMFNAITHRYKHDNQSTEIKIEQYDKNISYASDNDVDWKEFRNTWENLKDTHDFFPMLKRFNVERQQALRNIGSDFAYEVDNSSSRKILEKARDKECEIMVFVGNRGCLQIHTGPVEKLAEMGDWFNVMDPIFNLHLNQSSISKSWVTKKPTEDGIVTALEVYDEYGELIVTFFGKRKPGIPELELWREIVQEIPIKIG